MNGTDCIETCLKACLDENVDIYHAITTMGHPAFSELAQKQQFYKKCLGEGFSLEKYDELDIFSHKKVTLKSWKANVL